jgi:hypothetical protein
MKRSTDILAGKVVLRCTECGHVRLENDATSFETRGREARAVEELRQRAEHISRAHPSFEERLRDAMVSDSDDPRWG